MKKFVRKIISSLGYTVRRFSGNEEQDAFEIQALLTLERPRVIFDVGAYVGTVTIKYHKIFPEAIIHAFEPSPEAFEQLKTNVEGIKNIYLHKQAISNEDHILMMNSNNYSATNSILSTDPNGIRYWGPDLLGTTQGQFQAETTTIDTFCQKNSIDYIDILKLDIQGAELQALKGAHELLSCKRISVIYFEMIISPTYRGQGKFHECLQLLDSYGYELFDIFDPLRHNKRLMQIDVISIKRFPSEIV